MIQNAPSPFSCRLEAANGMLSRDEFCAFEFPWCEGCPKPPVGKVAALEDPMMSPIWRGWISGLPGRAR